MTPLARSTEIKKSRIDSIARTTRLLLRMNQGRPGVPKSEVLYYKMLAAYFDNILKAKEQGKLLATHTVFFPVELLFAMDVVPMHTEGTTWFTAMFTQECADILAAGADLGLGPEVCSVHRALAGAFHLGTLPRPDMILWSNLVCDNTSKSGEMLMEMTGAPGFFIDHPFKRSPAEVKYLTEELGDLVAFLEKQTGRKMDWDRLKQAVARIDYEVRLIREINELRKAVPSPFGPMSFLKIVAVDYLFTGQPEAIEYFETLRDELAAKVKAGEGCVPKEKFRLMTVFIPPLQQMAGIEKVLAEHGAVEVVEPYFTAWPEGRFDPEKPLEAVALKCFNNPELRMYGPLDAGTLQIFTESARDYKIDGAINFAHVGCRQTCGAIKLLKDTLDGADVPMFNLDCDIIDATSISEEEVRARLEQFFEMLEER
jgi:benzoyl-CoA reductase/2-hydroxyglutaryl-CoA dehydratase subunit BcrC/BadD/HgdB